LSFRLLRSALERLERLLPEPIEIGPQLGQASRLDRVHPASPLGAIGDEAGLLEDSKVLGDGGAADREAVGNLTDGTRTQNEAFEDRAPGGITERVPRAALVSGHLR